MLEPIYLEMMRYIVDLEREVKFCHDLVEKKDAQIQQLNQYIASHSDPEEEVIDCRPPVVDAEYTQIPTPL